MYSFSIKKSEVFKQRKDVKYNELPLETRLFLSNPF